MAQPFAQPYDRGLIEAGPYPLALGCKISTLRRRMVLGASVLASSLLLSTAPCSPLHCPICVPSSAPILQLCMMIAGPLCAALAYGLLALSQNAPFALGVVAPMPLLGISFAVLVAPLTASVTSSVKHEDEGLATDAEP
jgi:hypothetical protein